MWQNILKQIVFNHYDLIQNNLKQGILKHKHDDLRQNILKQEGAL